MKKVTYKVNSVGCHICTSHRTDKDGYAQIYMDGKKYQLHRYIYEKKYGKIKDNKIVMHICNNPSCINIQHLIIGTNKDNSDYMVKSGRSAKWEKCPRSKLTKFKVRKIRELQGKKTLSEIATMFDIHQSNVWWIQNNLTWKGVI